MSCLSWNCRGLGNLHAIQALKRLVLSKDPMVVFLCEMNNSRDHMERLKLQLRFDCFFIVPSKGSSGGLCAIWKDEANLLLCSYLNNHFDFEVGGVRKLNHWRLTCFYGFPAEVDRHKSWSLLGQLHANSSLPWCCIGDFNKVLRTDEQENGDMQCER